MISSDKNLVLQTNNPEFAAASESGIGPISIGNSINQWIKQIYTCGCWRSSKQPWQHEEWTLEYILRVNDLLVIFILIWEPFLSVHVFVPWPWGKWWKPTVQSPEDGQIMSNHDPQKFWGWVGQKKTVPETATNCLVMFSWFNPNVANCCRQHLVLRVKSYMFSILTILIHPPICKSHFVWGTLW